MALNPDLLHSRLLTVGDGPIEGCTDEEIKIIENHVKLKLPKAYIEFLKIAGKRSGEFMCDIDFKFPWVLEFTKEWEERLVYLESGNLLLPDNSFVFEDRYGEQCMFFVADGESDDPTIYHYYELQSHFRKVCDSIWEHLESELLMHEEYHKSK